MIRPRPVLRWHGGKWNLAKHIIQFFPPHRVYVSAYGGAASDLLRKPRSYAEVYNDLDGEVVNLFRILQSPAKWSALIDLLRATPFARAEFDKAYASTRNKIESARRLIIRSFMGFGSDGCNLARPTGFRAKSNRSGTTPAHDWANYPDCLDFAIERFRGVVIEHRNALEVMAAHDGHHTLHYCDPPYLHRTRQSNKRYRHEMTLADHERMLSFVLTLNGMVIVSGYPDPLYDDLLSEWDRREIKALADGARPRIEVLWINPLALARHAETLPMFELEAGA